MSVQNEIDRITQNVENTYAVLEALGAELPEEQNSDNMATTAGTAKALLYSEQSLTEKQKAQARENIGAVGSWLDFPDAPSISEDMNDVLSVDDSNGNTAFLVSVDGTTHVAKLIAGEAEVGGKGVQSEITGAVWQFVVIGKDGHVTTKSMDNLTGAMEPAFDVDVSYAENVRVYDDPGLKDAIAGLEQIANQAFWIPGLYGQFLALGINYDPILAALQKGRLVRMRADYVMAENGYTPWPVEHVLRYALTPYGLLLNTDSMIYGLPIGSHNGKINWDEDPYAVIDGVYGGESSVVIPIDTTSGDFLPEWTARALDTGGGVFANDDEMAEFDVFEGQLPRMCVELMFFATEEYDSLYDALQNGAEVKYKIGPDFYAEYELYFLPIQPVEAYLLTPQGLVVYTKQLLLIYRNGSYHNADTDPYA